MRRLHECLNHVLVPVEPNSPRARASSKCYNVNKFVSYTQHALNNVRTLGGTYVATFYSRSAAARASGDWTGCSEHAALLSIC